MVCQYQHRQIELSYEIHSLNVVLTFPLYYSTESTCPTGCIYKTINQSQCDFKGVFWKLELSQKENPSFAFYFLPPFAETTNSPLSLTTKKHTFTLVTQWSSRGFPTRLSRKLVVVMMLVTTMMVWSFALLLLLTFDVGVAVSSDNARSVKFLSRCDELLNLYWIGDAHETKSAVLIVEIQPHGSVDVQTFTGHAFYASRANDNVRALPRKVEVSSDSSDFAADWTVHETRPLPKVYNKNRDPSVNRGVHPAVTFLNSGTKAMSVKFKNLSPGCEYYYDNGADGIYQGKLVQGGEATTNTYEGHIFYFTKIGDKSSVFARFVMHKEQVVYVITDPTSLPPRHMQEQADKERAFLKEYHDRTGLHWRHYFGPNGPRGPPVLHMWDAQEIGQVHNISSKSGHWKSGRDCEAHEESTGETSVCQDNEPLHLELEVISLAPRAFVIENFLSDYECTRIIESAKDKLMISTVGNGDAGGARTDGTRTSKNAWLSRDTNDVTESLFLRAADVLNVDEKILVSGGNAEDMQVVHYIDGQKYDSHHDWGVSGYPESRFITLLLYLTDQPGKSSGGETAFPKADGGRGIKVHPGKGSAVLFYNLLEDGNGDDLALHAAMPVRNDHEKWLANYWVWDPKRK
eukprot:GSChrysophyteH1.ASY1.ANO1.2912.1 assembled CDS